MKNLNPLENRNPERKEPIGPAPALDMHERAKVFVRCNRDKGVVITVDTESGFVSAPQIVLQRENGRRTTLMQARPDQNEGRTFYVTSFEFSEPYLDATIIVTGVAESGMVASAVEEFITARITAPGEYEVFGPGGALVITISVESAKDSVHSIYDKLASQGEGKGSTTRDTGSASDSNCPSPAIQSIAAVHLCICPSPTYMLPSSRGLLPVSDAFTISGADGGNFTRPLRLTFRARLNDLPPEMKLAGEPKVAIYRWEARTGWSELEDSTHVNPTSHSVEAKINLAGVYAIFASEGEFNAEELRTEYLKLRSLVVHQARQLEQFYSASQLNQGMQTREPLIPNISMLPPKSEQAGGW